jgi:hypothetical protein
MGAHFTARIFLEKEEVTHQDGEDANELYTWMLARADGVFGNCHGEIIDNYTKKVIQQFRKAPPD